MTLPLFVLACVACFKGIEPTVLPPAVTPCLHEPPPRDARIEDVRDGGCPQQFTVCFDGVNASKLFLSIVRSRRWRDEAWTRCGPVVAGNDGRVDGGA